MIEDSFNNRLMKRIKEIKEKGGVGPKTIGLSNTKSDKLYRNNKKSEEIIKILINK